MIVCKISKVLVKSTKLRIHSKLDRNQSKLTVCTVLAFWRVIDDLFKDYFSVLHFCWELISILIGSFLSYCMTSRQKTFDRQISQVLYFKDISSLHQLLHLPIQQP